MRSKWVLRAIVLGFALALLPNGKPYAQKSDSLAERAKKASMAIQEESMLDAIENLKALDTSDDVPGLISVLKDKSLRSEVRTKASLRLKDLGAAEAVPILAKIARDSSEDLFLRVKCVRGLGGIKTSETLEILGTVLTDETLNDNLRAVSCVEISNYDDPEATNLIIEGSKSQRMLVRFKCAHVFARKLSPGAEKRLIEMLDDEDEFVTARAMDSLAEMKSKKAIPKIKRIALNKEMTTWIRIKSLYALRAIDESELLDVSRRLTKDENKTLLEELTYILANLDEEK